MRSFETLLLLGPTASGKTPLGEALEASGLWGRRCHHLDFGGLLRAASARRIHLSRSYRHIVDEVLRCGRLLDDDEWLVAEALIDSFLDDRAPDDEDLVVLNGIPRHVGQAEDVAVGFRVTTVVRLDASEEVLLERIRLDAGGDRAERVDDDETSVRRRIARFEDRTRPLVEHYRARGVRLVELPVGVETVGEGLRRVLAAKGPGAS